MTEDQHISLQAVVEEPENMRNTGFDISVQNISDLSLLKPKSLAFKSSRDQALLIYRQAIIST